MRYNLFRKSKKIARMITGPLSKLKEFSEKIISRGRLDTRKEITSKDEIGDLIKWLKI